MKGTMKRGVRLSGITDIMFDRYAGDNKTQLPPERKLYFGADGKTLVLPAANLLSFLSAQNTDSAPKRFMDPRQYKSVCQALLSYTVVRPAEIPFLNGRKPIRFERLGEPEDREAAVYVHRSVARLAKGIPNPKVRPVLRTPWALEFELEMYPTPQVSEDMLHDLFVKGGLAIGLGTFRGVFGKFEVEAWKTL